MESFTVMTMDGTIAILDRWISFTNITWAERSQQKRVYDV